MLKSESLDRLWQAVLSVSRGQVWMEKRFVAVMLEEEDNKARSGPDTGASDDRLKLASLTRRELEIIQAIGKGYKNKQIADALCISDTTVRHHLSTIFSKLNVSDRLELLIYAQRHGLVDIK
jgi:DNA-binding NarL/FixJ family response regulator